MKPNSRFFFTIVALLLSLSVSIAQSFSSWEAEIAERGAHHRTWQQVESETNVFDRVIYRTNSYTELETGMHFLKAGQWAESKAEIELLEEGAAATNSQHRVYFAANLNTIGAVDLVTPDGKRLRSRILGLSYFDSTTGRAVLIAETKDSIGLLVGTDRVLYTNAFDEVDASVEYVVSKAGLSQNILLKSQLPSPAEWSLNPQSSRLQVLTEFYGPPEPSKTAEIRNTGLIDEHLDFGAMQIGRGHAFAIGEAAEGTRLIPVAKEWAVSAGRTFLVEEVPFVAVDEEIQALSRRREGASIRQDRKGQGETVLAALRSVLPKRTAQAAKSQMRMARLQPATTPPGNEVTSRSSETLAALDVRRAFVLDYTILSSQSDFTFAGNTNYYVSGAVTLSGTTTIEGGTTIKFTNAAVGKITLSGPLVCQTDMYRPAVLTSRNDNTVGETISGSTGSPSNVGAGTYLDSTYSNPSNPIRYLRISYAGTGLSFDGITNGVWHSQFVNCNQGIDSFNQKPVRLYNVLMTGSSNCIVNSTNVRGEHLTVDVCSNLVVATSPTLALTNSILTGVLATGVGSPVYERVTTASSGSGIYQLLGAASYYLADGSTNRNAGSTNLTATLLSDLKLRTTYPPILVSANFTVDTVLSPQAMRDTDTPDNGYHYDPLDYVVSGRTVSANLALSNGVAVGTYGALSGYGLGLNTGSLVSEGTATRWNWIARYNTVQEQSTTTWSTTTVAPGVKMLANTPDVSIRLTGWSMLGATGDHFDHQNVADAPLSKFSHSQFFGGKFTVDEGSTSLTNCLWQRVHVYLRALESDPEWYLFNNLFYGGRLDYRATEDPVLLAYDNFFDKTVIVKGNQSASFAHNNNGYITGQNRLTSNGANDVILTNSPTYLTSYLGRYYYPTNDGMLSALINTGSRYATNAALYHFTTTTDQTKEAGTMVDIGYHYVATDGAGNPLDADGDGVPDYFEDTNGNGNGSDDATSWQNYNSPNGLVSGSGLQVFTPLK